MLAGPPMTPALTFALAKPSSLAAKAGKFTWKVAQAQGWFSGLRSEGRLRTAGDCHPKGRGQVHQPPERHNSLP